MMWGGRGRVHTGRWLFGLALLTWGVGLALNGLGLQHTPVGASFDVYWPLIFVAYGVAGLVMSVVQRGRGLFVHLLIILIAAAFLAEHLHVAHINGWTLFWAIVLLGLGVGIFARRPWWAGRWHLGDWQIGDVEVLDWHQGAQGSRARHISHFIGDVRLDLSDMSFPEGESSLEISAVIGDITVLVPQDLPVSVVGEVGVGDVRIFGQHADGVGRRLTYRSPDYATATRRVNVYAHLMVGDVSVHRF
jgi:predicted membrane protein